MPVYGTRVCVHETKFLVTNFVDLHIHASMYECTYSDLVSTSYTQKLRYCR